jgi:hypothetical protein
MTQNKLAGEIRRVLIGETEHSATVAILVKKIAAGSKGKCTPSANDIRAVARTHDWFDYKNGTVQLR